MSCCVARVDGETPGAGEGDSANFTDALELVPANTGAAPLNLGIPNTTSGGGSHPAITGTSTLEATPRWRATSAVGAGSSAGHRSVTTLATRGNVANVGGWRYRARFGVSTFVAGFRAFIGLCATTGALPTADPSALVDMVGMAYDLGTTQWQMMHNDGAGAATQVPLGASFNITANQFIQFEMSCLANAQPINYLVTDLVTGATASGTLSTNLPTSTVFLTTHAWVNTGNVAATAAQMDVVRIALAPPVLPP
jgi:hypothetical protein